MSEAANAQLVNKEYAEWGLHIERLTENPWAPKILYKIDAELRQRLPHVPPSRVGRIRDGWRPDQGLLLSCA